MSGKPIRALILFALFALLFIGERAYPGEPEGAYVRADSWQESMLASRARHQSRYGAPAITLGTWWGTAPLPAESFAELHVNPADPMSGAHFTEHPEWADGLIHQLPQIDFASSYLYRMIEVENDLVRTASLGSDDGVEVWLNGEKLLSHDVPRGTAPDQESVELPLTAGANHLLLKVHNQRGGHGFTFALRDPTIGAIWANLESDFPRECAWLRRDRMLSRHLEWFTAAGTADWNRALVAGLFEELSIEASGLEEIVASGAGPENSRWLDLYTALCRVRDARFTIDHLNLSALGRAVDDFAGDDPEPRKKLAAFEQRLPELRRILFGSDRAAALAGIKELAEIVRFRRDTLLGKPGLDLPSILVIRRKARNLGLPQNWQGNCSLPRSGFDDELVVLSLAGEPKLDTLYRPETPRQIADLDLDFDARRMLFSMLGTNDRWQIFELDAGAGTATQVTPGHHPDVDNYDACYLPDGRILFDSTRCFQGIPCVAGADQVANLHLLDLEDGSIRQVCFDQDHDWCPTVLNNGRVLYSRWEYSDTPHYFSRLLFHMNPDGTGQMEYYGSNSYWPNSIFYARPIPGHPTKIAGIVTGHHGVPRMGELVIFDPAKGRFEADGVVQRIPGWGQKVEPVIKDKLVDDVWPRFLHPWPLDEKTFLVSCQPSPEKPWGVYLVDVFDNMLCLFDLPGYALFEPTPFRPRERPPVIPDKVNLWQDEATVYLSDVYRGPGLAGVPRGTVKELRVYEFHYGYNKMGGHKNVGIEGPWDVHRILGKVPVYEDGSASFKVPANTPVAVQPLDAEGKALQVMRSWFTAMPGEVLSCTGCHESQNSVPPVHATLAARKAPVAIEPWYGPPRGFSFPRDVQPVLDKHCVGCHDGRESDRPDLTRKEKRGWGNFTPSYIALHPFVRRPGPESDYHLQKPMEWHADTSELIQMLVRGHHGVQLDDEAWDRLITWIDLNVPDHGTWGEHSPIPAGLAERRRAMRAEHAGRPEDLEEIVATPGEKVEFVPPTPTPEGLPTSRVSGLPFDREEARKRQMESGLDPELTVDLGDGIEMRFVPIPALGDQRPCYMGRFEVTREQYNRFDASHHNGFLNQNHKDHTTPGYPANGPRRPAIRVSFKEATGFCVWLSKMTGLRCKLPTEKEWEWACRAGTATPFSFGDLDTDFSKFANLADKSTVRLAVTGIDPKPIPNPNQYEDWLPKEARFDDGERLMCDVGRYLPNAWGLHDMHGNVAEWTRSPFDLRNEAAEKMVVRGGSWRDRPKNARSSWRWGYRSYQSVFNVGFRVVVHPEEAK